MYISPEPSFTNNFFAPTSLGIGQSTNITHTYLHRPLYREVCAIWLSTERNIYLEATEMFEMVEVTAMFSSERQR